MESQEPWAAGWPPPAPTGSAADTVTDLGVHFSELGGFVLLSPPVIAQELAPAIGDDVVARLAASDAGEDATDRGVAIPITLDESGDCRVLLRFQHDDDPVPPIWPLRVAGDRAILTTMGAMREWSPEVGSAVEIPLPDGWYAVRATLGPGGAEADLTLTLTVTPTPGPVSRTADLDVRLASDGAPRTPGLVSVWTGRFGGTEGLEEHVRRHRPDSGPVWSGFARATGLGWYDDDQSRSIWLGHDGGSFAAHPAAKAFAARADADLVKRPDDDGALLLFDVDARDLPAPSGPAPLRLLGVYRYRT